MTNRETTSKRAASAALKILRSNGPGESTQSTAGSTLSRRNAPSDVTNSRAASAAIRILRDNHYNKPFKASASLMPTQKPDHGK
uniref:Uncharacterized protein n=1 Tax=Candidatus Kentrum sp. MB TaxID=2138164 RepID=A0A450XMX4_9GAMM|nr:MAG: hypothetical protein BECKMB1821I_GA0114274_10174 [Candidatus Kentron sp. MB]VFK75363.1 MAG: hypothetical protein BECKMB1821H_GA0114242_102038 [Candidatus Kentron sp. MB]